MNNHLNLFYSYQTHHLEDNVTRALLITFRNLSPLAIRLFLQQVVLPKAKDEIIKSKISMLSEPEFIFDTQSSYLSESMSDDKKFVASNCLILGINYSGMQKLYFQENPDIIDSRSRLDGIIVDKTNELCVLIEVKLWDWLYSEQITKIFQNYFDTKSTILDNIFVEISWTDIIDFLSKIVLLTSDTKEKFLIEEFMQYCDFLKLTDFVGFKGYDFLYDQTNDDKLQKFLNLIYNNFKDSMNVKEYVYNDQIHFENLWDNLWVTYYWKEEGLVFDIVIGSGKKWRAQNAKNYVLNSSDNFFKIIADVKSSLPDGSRTFLIANSVFYYSRFRKVQLSIGQDEYSFPEEFPQFLELITDDKKNSFAYYNKEKINTIFSDDIKRDGPELDSGNLFPHWDDIDEYLQYCYIDVMNFIPKKFFLNKSATELCKTLEPILSALRTGIQKLNDSI